MESKVDALLKSRKFWAAVVAVVVIVLRGLLPNFPLSDEQVQQIVMTMIAFIVGTGLSDIRPALK